MSLAALSGARTATKLLLLVSLKANGLTVLNRDAVGVDLDAIRSTSADIDRIARAEVQPGVGVVRSTNWLVRLHCLQGCQRFQ